MIANLKDARAMRRMGLPLDTPVEHRVFSKEYSHHWFALMDAHYKFMDIMYEFVDASTPAMLKRVRRRFDKLVALVKTSPRFEDATERAILATFKQKHALPFLEYWTDALDAIADGTGLTIYPGDIPTWVEG
jgi:hypothetical protein